MKNGNTSFSLKIARRFFICSSVLFWVLIWQARIASAAVFINEIAWMGTSDSTSNEWVELANDGSPPADMTGWILSIEGKKDIALSGNISAGGFYLIERTDDTTVPTVLADLVASFGSGLSNTGAALSLKNASGAVVDRVDGSQEWSVGGVVAGNNTTKETAQRGSGGWLTGTPTPRTANIGTASTPVQESGTNTTQANTNPIVDSFPVEPQIIADAGVSTRIVSTGAPTTFTGRVFGLKKEPIENARLVWSFGDGGRGEGVSVAHTYYYPGDYIVVLDASSGYYAASDRVAVRVAAPLLALRTGGDTARSFIAVENRGSDEVDLSLWQVKSGDKIFILPQNTVLGARKTLTLASEVTGLSSPIGSVASLHFPNGTRVEMQGDISAPDLVRSPTGQGQLLNIQSAPTVPVAPAVASVRTPDLPVRGQEAVVLGAVDTTVDLLSVQEGGGLWPWYIGAAFLGVLALLGIRFARSKEAEIPSPADNFEIFEDEGEKNDVF